MDPYEIILYPVGGDRALVQTEKENKIIFVVARRATKTQIKAATEQLYNVRVRSVNTLIAPNGKKRAFVRLEEGESAEDLAAKLGVF